MISAKKCVQLFACTVFFSTAVIPAGFAAGAGAKKPSDAPIYVDFKHIVVPVIRQNGRTGIVALNVMAEVKDEQAQTIVTNHLPRLKDAFIRSLYGSMDDTKMNAQNGTLDIERIKTRLMQTANLVLKDKDGPIKDILFQNITQQTY